MAMRVKSLLAGEDVDTGSIIQSSRPSTKFVGLYSGSDFESLPPATCEVEFSDCVFGISLRKLVDAVFQYRIHTVSAAFPAMSPIR